ncbi:MAG: imidazoleglycerol-phosphate dehydratase HisB [Clostridia bacterium]|nr:imidazoleglycerol-phosphate dehydratase HisB [Clostridia bacterium]
MRVSKIDRKTRETDISLRLDLDGTGKCNINTDCGFLNHMLELFAKHSRFDLDVTCKGDTEVDFHHTVEDVGIVLGQAISEALGDKRGITRYGSMILPMDETLVLTAVDISGRAYLNFDAQMPCQKVGEMDTELVEEFFWAFVRNCNVTLHIKLLDGKNTHHIIEGVFKSFARTMKTAVSIDPSLGGEIPSSKGVL